MAKFKDVEHRKDERKFMIRSKFKDFKYALRHANWDEIVCVSLITAVALGGAGAVGYLISLGVTGGYTNEYISNLQTDAREQNIIVDESCSVTRGIKKDGSVIGSIVAKDGTIWDYKYDCQDYDYGAFTNKRDYRDISRKYEPTFTPRTERNEETNEQ